MHEWVRKMALNANDGGKMVMELDVDMRLRLWTSNWEWITALNAKVQMWLWTPNGKWTMALNAKRNNGSERQNGAWTIALKAKRKWTALNAKMENEQWPWTPNGKWTMTLNAKWKMWWIWTPNEKCDGSERQMEKHGFERQNETMALNAKLKRMMW